MKILYLLEPAIELRNPEFRYATLRSTIIHQIKALRSSGNQTHLITSEALARRAMHDGFLEALGSICAVDHTEWTDGENPLARSLRHQSMDYKEGEIDRLRRIIHTQLPSDFTPDLIFVWESPMYFLEEIFPTARVIYQSPGFFSRAPFPELVKFDKGLLDRAVFPAGVTNKESNIDSTIEKLRFQDKNFFQSLNLVEPLLINFKCKYQGLVLFPLQVDGYFMVDYLLQGRSQFDIILDLLQKTPPNIGVLVTNYWSANLRSAVLGEESIRYLRNKFTNFIYIEKFNSIHAVSQLLLPYVDGVYTISSSLGYQAAYWGKPLFCFDNSHIAKYKTAATLEVFWQQVGKNMTFYQDELVKHDIQNSHFPLEWIKEKPRKFVAWVNALISPTKTHSWISDSHFLKEISELRREHDYLRLYSNLEKTNNRGNTITKCAELSEQICKHEIISFDIFDTLLLRPFKNPSDMFDFMSADAALLCGFNTLNFKDVRRQSERLAFETALGRGDGETDIDEIYEHFQQLVGCSTEEANNVKHLEMQMEYDLLYERKSAKTAFNQAIASGKRIIIVSDMYLPRKFLEKVLHKNGYEGYEKIFVSSEVKLKKHSGRLFDHLLMELGVPPASILHIGDNLQADVVNAKNRGIKAFHLAKPLESFEKTDAYKSVWSRDEDRLSLDAKMLIAFSGNTLQDNPYLPSRRGTLFSGDSWQLGYYGFGMFLLGYVKWLLEEATCDKIDRLYFLSRDGLVMKKAYDLLCKYYPNAPQSHYLLCSRRAVNLAKVKDEADIIDLLNVDYAQTSVRDLFDSRFGLNHSDIDDVVLKQHGLTLDSRVNNKDRPILKEILLSHKEKILSVALHERNNYLQYLKDEGLFERGNIAIVDIGYAGTMQESLYQLINFRKKIGGYYLITFRQALKRIKEKGLFANAYLANFVDRHDTFHPFCKFVPLYETLFSNAETTLVKIEKDWMGRLHPIYMDRFPQEEVRENLVTRVHAGALQFIDNFSSVLGPRLHKVDIEPHKSMRVLNHYFSAPHFIDAKIMEGIVFEDSYGGAGLKVILSRPNDLKANIIWNNGREALMRESSSRFNQPRKIQTNNQGKFYLEKFLITYFIGKFASAKKYKKFMNNPHAFFNDSRKICGHIAKNIYFLRE